MSGLTFKGNLVQTLRTTTLVMGGSLPRALWRDHVITAELPLLPDSHADYHLPALTFKHCTLKPSSSRLTLARVTAQFLQSPEVRELPGRVLGGRQHPRLTGLLAQPQAVLGRQGRLTGRCAGSCCLQRAAHAQATYPPQGGWDRCQDNTV